MCNREIWDDDLQKYIQCPNPETEPHPCPFIVQIEGDESLCTCCEDCQDRCADDI